jgi:hypothetical protein
MEDTKGVLAYFVRLAEWLSHGVEHSVCEASLQDETVFALYELQSTDGNRERGGLGVGVERRIVRRDRREESKEGRGERGRAG